MFNVAYIGVAVCAMIATSSNAAAAPPISDCADVEAVRSAVLDYLEGLYSVAPQRIARSVSPDLAKYGWYVNQDGQEVWATMSYDELVALASRYNRNGTIPANAPREVEVFEVEDHIASAKLTASWGVDYLLLNKDTDGRWRIRQVLWQGRTSKPAATQGAGGAGGSRFSLVADD